ncbi:hypothetical protein Syn7803C72_134 [Synechococcus phage ACG-2014d]|jgi:hypothetical protein|uniref:Gp163 n=1 Tax=Synechococcus phage ACG-2014d TaxID=1493509 RepID=A0A0E3HFS9_9CAUD|nr:hypothetical protein AAJ59_gp134 [Synechococcus phage ACG-2014d]YP_010355304.1 hypothetical protein M1M12_gp135 [Synechococcus phage ACG-2014d]AIX14746.1 hypothetical protein Syn7803C45_135 [Synechococcus phage ACG-2014d]AIX14965.1 hypothetical protein Syn7803C46_134 [Synechococcus phage ACG-2014d]AIX15392.1 hypothetical protein Syn7803C48_134 [Synechococcus phage ACG-2014d]AIX15610.1 hypothetical protein Syn7803C49_134 [Synechococcus phage ACG-2014d]AIX16040.1 hypothetical protein Syn7803
MEDTKQVEIKSPVKTIAFTLGGLFALAHIGLLGYVINRPEEPKVPQVPTINIPRGDYSSYTIKAGKDGYEIEYRANDPAILESERSLEVDKERRGLFGGGSEVRNEWRRDQFTMDGTRNLGGAALDGEGKSAKDIECIVADAGARSQGAMAGSAIAAGVAVPALASIPYVGWLAGGWALLLGQKAGSSLGSQVGSVFNDC